MAPGQGRTSKVEKSCHVLSAYFAQRCPNGSSRKPTLADATINGFLTLVGIITIGFGALVGTITVGLLALTFGRGMTHPIGGPFGFHIGRALFFGVHPLTFGQRTQSEQSFMPSGIKSSHIPSSLAFSASESLVSTSTSSNSSDDEGISSTYSGG